MWHTHASRVLWWASLKVTEKTNKQLLKHLVRWDWEETRKAPQGDVWFYSEITRKDGGMGRKSKIKSRARTSEEVRNAPTNHKPRTHTERNKIMAFKCTAVRPCDSHGVVSWEHPPPLISLMDYNNRKSAWPAPHHTTPTDSCSLFSHRNIHACAEGIVGTPLINHMLH